MRCTRAFEKRMELERTNVGGSENLTLFPKRSRLCTMEGIESALLVWDAPGGFALH